MDASAENRLTEMEDVIQTGVRHAAILLEQDPRAAYVRDVTASLDLRLALVYCRTGRVEQAVPLFQRAIRQIESLCADFPWNRQYWITAQYVHNEACRSLETVGRREDAKPLMLQSYAWIQATSQQLPDEFQPQMDLLKCQTHVAGCLQFLGQEREANQLARTALELHRRIQTRASGMTGDDKTLVHVRLLLPVELLPEEEVAKVASEELRPALEQLKSDPKEFAAAAHALVERAYRARENYQLAAALALSLAVADAALNSPLLAESRIEGLDEAMHNQWRMGRLDQAELTGREVLAIAHQQSSRHWVESSTFGRLAEIALARGQFNEAEIWARKSLDSINRIGHRNTLPAFVHLLLARALGGQGKQREALSALEQAWKESDRLNFRDDAGQAFYEWLAAARASDDPSVLADVARAALEHVNSRDPRSLDGLHLAWRAMAQEAQSEQQSANSDWNRAFEQGLGDVKAHAFLALARLQQGDLAGYRRVCEQLVERLGTTADENACFRIAWTCAVGPQAIQDLAVPFQLASNIVEQNPKNAAYLCTAGALLYRMDRYEEAAERLRQSIDAFAGDYSNQLSAFYPQYFLAMTLWRIDRQTESRELLAEIQMRYDDAINLARPWNRRAALEVLSHEALGLIIITPAEAIESSSDPRPHHKPEQETQD
jgi:tetratricopeptide (TPR) repeat protein